MPTVRRLLGRRASQNVVSRGGDAKAAALVLVAHYDAGGGGLAHSDRAARRLARRPVGGLQAAFWAELGVLACALLRLAGLDYTRSRSCSVPNAGLIVAVALLLDVALRVPGDGENDNASGSVVVLSLVERFGAATRSSTSRSTWSLTGAQKAGCAGMRAFLERHRERLAGDRTVFLNVDTVGSGQVRFTRREGALLMLRSHPQLVALCEQIVEDGSDAQPLVIRAASDALGRGRSRPPGDHGHVPRPARLRLGAGRRAGAPANGATSAPS